ncbi:MAG: hypothetical protein V4463_17275 [Pseudomonadota bacterium]
MKLSLICVPLWLAGCAPVTPIITNVNPVVVTVALTRGAVDPVNTCTPATPPSPPAPDAWFNGLPAGQPPKVVGEGVVGFHLWRNTTDACQEFRQDLYRTEFSYPLGSVSALKGLVTKAELTLSSAIIPAVRPGSLCQAKTGAGGSLLALPATTILPPAALTLLAPNAPFDAGSRVFAMTFPWLPGSIPNNTVTQAAGGGLASFTVDVTGRLNAALVAGGAAMVFALSGSDETRPAVPPPGDFDCRTIYKIGPLAITHL